MHHESRRTASGIALLLGALALGACESELPTEVGGEHLPESALRTYEILLDDAAFLSGDSLIRGFGASEIASVLIVAQDFLDTLDAHSLIRFGGVPTTVSYSDSNAVVTDTVDAYVSGRFVVRIDTLSLERDTLATDTLEFEVYRLAEGFDARTASWVAREALPDDTTFWTTPGGTVGDLIGSATWTPGDTIAGDSMVFTIDSTAMTELALGDDETRAILIRTTTPRVRAQIFVPRLQVTVGTRNDTTLRTVTSVVEAQTYIIDPPAPAPLDEIRVGDRTAWRTFLTFLPSLDTLTIPCPNEPGCTFRLGDVIVNRAELRLTALAVPEPWRIRSNMVLEARPVLGDETRPLERAPVGDTTGVAFGIQPADFASDGDSTVTIGVTRVVRGLLATDSTLTERNRTITLLSAPEPLPYGIARFGGFGSENAPVLRVIVTVPAREEEL